MNPRTCSPNTASAPKATNATIDARLATPRTRFVSSAVRRSTQSERTIGEATSIGMTIGSTSWLASVDAAP